MRALVLEAHKKLTLCTVPDPVPGSGEVLVQVKACGICGSDVHGYDGSTGRRRPPVIMGHEAAGVVAGTGADVTGWQPGDRVTFDSTIYCGECYFCRQGRINLCDNRCVLGVSCEAYRRDGAFAEYVVVPQHILYRLPDSLDFAQAAMVEALSIGFHAVSRSGIQGDDSVLVLGTGMIGLLTVQAARLAGCGRIIAVDVDTDKLALARRMGASVTLNPRTDEVLAGIAEATSGRGADHAFEAVGMDETVAMAVSGVRKGGVLTLIGNLSPSVSFPLQAAVTGELTVHGSCASCGEYPACLDSLAEGRVDVSPLISAVASLSEGADWFGRLYAGEKGLMKVILVP